MAVVVVGAAIVRDGRLLAARRSAPAHLAGRWELPGGKVEPGETEHEAAVRECREELGVDVTPLRRLPGEPALRPGLVLHAWVCRLVRGDPLPLEDHDALRWLGPDELTDVDWLDPDRPLLGPIREVLLDGEPLGTGATGAVRVAATVRRPAGPWTPTVHALLDHLRAAGVPGVPAPAGVDERGREVLSWLPGEPPPSPVPDELLAATAAWLRQVHEASRTFRPPVGGRWRTTGPVRPLRPDEVVCHHDPAPRNLLAVPGSGGRALAGVLDWDTAGPGHPLDDVAFLAWAAVPLHPAGSPRETARRLSVVARAYGATAADVAARVEPRMRTAVRRIRHGAGAGDPGMARLVAAGVPDQVEAALDARTMERPHPR